MQAWLSVNNFQDPHPDRVRDIKDYVDPIPYNQADAAEIDSDEITISEAYSDQSTLLTGLTTRNVTGQTHGSRQGLPFWKEFAATDYNTVVDRQVSTSGTASQRENAGHQGVGTMQYTYSITPELREGMELGDTHFEAVPKKVQQGSTSAVTSPVSDPVLNSVAQRSGTEQARKASQASLFQSWLGN